MPNTLEVFSPVDGVIIPVEQVPDPVFNERMLGDGVAVDPASNVIFAPFDGKISNLNKGLHALVLTQNNFEVLIHVGLETVNLKGQGFKPFVKEGDAVKKGQKLLEFDRDFIAKNAPSSLVILVVTSPADTKITPASGQVKAGERLFTAGTEPDAATDDETTPQWPAVESEALLIINPNGLHARPAGVLAKASSAYPFDITLHKNGQETNAKSVVGIMSLAVDKGDKIILRARAQRKQDAQEALQTLSKLVQDGLGESEPAVCRPPAPCLCSEQKNVDFSKHSALKALTACIGLAQGRAFQLQTGEITFEENAADPEAEINTLDATVSGLAQDIEQQIANTKNESTRGILKAHLEILKDPFLSRQAHNAIRAGKSASYGFNEAVRNSIDLIKKTNNRFLMERIADFKDLRKRVLLKLNGQEETAPAFPKDCIVFASDLLPSDLAFFNENIKGAVLAACSPTAHTAIMLRNMGLPSLVSAGECVLSVPDGTPVGVDATEGVLYVNPNESERNDLAERIAKANEQELKNREASKDPAVTKDGVRVIVGGNISNEKEAYLAYQNGAESLGLVRTEFLFFQGASAPSQDSQFTLYQNIANAMHGRPITLRTLDVGGDKPVQYIKIPPEENPIVGLRGVRNYGTNREIFLSQIRAMLRVQPSGVVRIMLPMVSFVGEVTEYRRIIEEEKKKLGISASVEVGIMIEVPAAALMAEQFAQYADFFSLGTNDLTQYTLAIDRGHKTLSALADSLNPAVLKLIEMTCRGAAKYERETAVCGAMAGDLKAIPLLVGLGVRELAVAANAVAQIKALIRSLDAKQCREAALHALTLSCAAEVREFVHQKFNV